MERAAERSSPGKGEFSARDPGLAAASVFRPSSSLPSHPAIVTTIPRPLRGRLPRSTRENRFRHDAAIRAATALKLIHSLISCIYPAGCGEPWPWRVYAGGRETSGGVTARTWKPPFPGPREGAGACQTAALGRGWGRSLGAAGTRLLLPLRLCYHPPPRPPLFSFVTWRKSSSRAWRAWRSPRPGARAIPAPAHLPVGAQSREGLQGSPQRRTENPKLADRGPSEKPTS